MKYSYYPAVRKRHLKEAEDPFKLRCGTWRELTQLEDWNCCGAAMATGVSYLSPSLFRP